MATTPTVPTPNKFVTPGKLKELTGSVLTPEHARLAIIFVPVSVSGEYSAPVYDKLTKRWTKVKQDYRERFINRDKFKLGENITTAILSDTWVVQGLCVNDKGKLDKNAFEACLKKLVDTAKYERAFVHVSDQTCKQFTGFKKTLAAAALPVGLNVYVYSDDSPEMVKR